MADGGPIAPDMKLKGIIDAYGVLAVMGRPTLYAREIYRMNYTANVQTAFESRSKSVNWATWAKDNDTLAAILADAMRAAEAEQCH